MPITTHTVTAKIADLLGAQYDQVRVTVRTNLGPGEAPIDTIDGRLLIGHGAIMVTNGTLTIPGLIDPASPGVNPSGIQYAIRIDYLDRVTRQAGSWDSGWLSVTADGDLATMVATQYAPPSWQTSFTQSMETLRDESVAARDQAKDISQIATPDNVVKTLIQDPVSQTRSALAASIGDMIVDRGNGLNLRSLAGFGPGITNITPHIVAAAAISKHVVIPVHPAGLAWPLLTRLDLADVQLTYEPGARISFNTNQRAMDLTRVTLVGAHHTSAFTGPASATDNDAAGNYISQAREVRLNDGCVVRGYYHENAATALNITAGSDITLSDVECRNIRHYKGWGAAIHISGVGSTNIRGTGFRFIDCDRGIEIEAGARDVWLDNGSQLRTYPKPYPGQPADFATYTFTLGAHSHTGEAACVNINGRNWLLEDCQGAVQIVLSNGTDAAPMPRFCTFEGIRILGTHDTGGGYDAVSIQGYGNVVRDVYFMSGAGTSSRTRIRFWGNSGSGMVASDANRVENVRAESGACALPFVQVDDGAVNSVLDGLRVPSSGLAGTGWVIDVAARYFKLRSAALHQVTGTEGYVRFQATADYSRIVGLDYSVATAETFTRAVLIDGAENVQISGVQGSNFATTPPKDIAVEGAARYASIQGNNIDRGAGVSIDLAAACSRNFVTRNVLSTGTATIANAGTENQIVDNLRGNAFA